MNPTYHNPYPHFTISDYIDMTPVIPEPHTYTQHVKSTSNVKRINITLSFDEHTTLKKRAKEQHMNVSEFIRKRCLYDSDTSSAHAAEVLKHVAAASNYINALPQNELKQKISQEVQTIWQYLRK